MVNQNRNKLIKYLSLFLASVLLLMSCFAVSNYPYVYASADIIDELKQQEAETQNAISSLEKESAATREAINTLQQQQEEAKNNVADLKKESAALSSTYSNYANQLDTLSGQIAEAEAKLSETSGQIVKLNNDLQDNRQAESELYEKLKMQIKMSYETSINKSLVITLLSSKSLSDFLNRAEYVTAIVEYQQKLLKQYKEIGLQIEEEAQELEIKEAELDEYQSTLDEKQGQIAGLAGAVKSELNETNSSLNSEQSKVSELGNQLDELDKKQKALEAQVAEAQAKLAQQIAARLAAQEAAGKKENTGGTYYASDSELLWLAATIMAEAGNQSYTGKLGVGTVIMNRVFSSQFPNTVQGLITQNMQFASYRSGKVQYYMEHGPSSSCVQAAQEVLNGARIGDYLFFMTKKYADYYRIADYTMIGAHAFFYKWVTLPKEEPAQDEQPAEQPQEQPAEQPQEAPAEEQPAEQPQEASAEEQPAEQPQEAPAE